MLKCVFIWNIYTLTYPSPTDTCCWEIFLLRAEQQGSAQQEKKVWKTIQLRIFLLTCVALLLFQISSCGINSYRKFVLGFGVLVCVCPERTAADFPPNSKPVQADAIWRFSIPDWRASAGRMQQDSTGSHFHWGLPINTFTALYRCISTNWNISEMLLFSVI